MAKAKWLDTNWWDADKATRPLTMAGRVGPSRRLRLVAAAYVRSVYPGVTPLRSLAKHADRIERAADEPLLPDKQTIPHWVNDLSRADADAKVVLSALRLVLHYATEHTALGRKDRKQVPANTRVMLAILRDVFGDQFSPPRPDPAWRTDTAVAIARQMYESRDFSAMPILADALQDAGCDDADVLSHCRDANQTHVRGCWVVDLVLGKE